MPEGAAGSVEEGEGEERREQEGSPQAETIAFLLAINVDKERLMEVKMMTSRSMPNAKRTGGGACLPVTNCSTVTAAKLVYRLRLPKSRLAPRPRLAQVKVR